MIKNNGNEQLIEEAVNSAIKKYGESREELIPILNHVNRLLGYLPSESLEKISDRLKSPRSNLFSVASFYQMLSTKPRGEHVIQFCESAPCHVVGGREVWQALQDTLQIQDGETTSDGKWTLITTSCLGLCGVGPVIVIDDDAYGNVTPDQIKSILTRYENLEAE
jgi:NADH-quinone oxidoreductase subunit E